MSALAGVDVLTVMENAVYWCGSDVGAMSAADELADAREAVAELIEADKEYDAAHEAYYTAPLSPSSAHRKAHGRWIKATERRRAALSRAGGAV